MLKNSNTKNLIIVFTLIVAGITGFLASKQYFTTESKVSYQSLLVYPQQKNFSGFKLVDKNNQSLDINKFSKHWTLLFFGYTHCPDVCPTTLTELQKTIKILQSKKIKQVPDVLFVSVDSERDTPEILNGYINFFNSNFNAATADTANLLALASQIGVAFHIGDHEKGEKNYDVDHTAAVFLVNPEKQLYGIFRSPHDSNKMADDLIQLIGSN